MTIRKSLLGVSLLSILSLGCSLSEKEKNVIGGRRIADNEEIILHPETPLLNGDVWNYSLLRDGDRDGHWDVVEKYRGNTLIKVYIKNGYQPGQSTSVPLEIVTEQFFRPYEE
ncbi:MAG: hypothetical protein Q8R18_00055 [bacterium]|nr:hypothetical protein [bacterium]